MWNRKILGTWLPLTWDEIDWWNEDKELSGVIMWIRTVVHNFVHLSKLIEWCP